jgi:preprotein translocase subunit SecG
MYLAVLSNTDSYVRLIGFFIAMIIMFVYWSKKKDSDNDINTDNDKMI